MTFHTLLPFPNLKCSFLLSTIFYYIDHNLFLLQAKINFGLIISFTYLTLCFYFSWSSFLHFLRSAWILLKDLNPRLI